MLLLFLLPFAMKQAKGQEFPWSLHYMTNMHTISPAYVGMWNQGRFMLSTRIDWAGISGAPLTQQISCYTPIKDTRSSMGLNILRMNVGREERLFFTGDYSYQIRLDLNHYMRFGIRAGIVNYDNNLSDYQAYPDHIPDPVYSNDAGSYYMSVFGIGAVYFSDELFLSLSVPQIVNNTFKVDRTIVASSPQFKTMYLSGGYLFHLHRSVRLRPNLLIIETVGNPVCFDVAAMVFLPSGLQWGINLRSNGDVCFSGQYTINNNLRIGYAANYAIIQDIRKYQLGTYEIVVGYDFNLSKMKTVRTFYF